VRITLIAAAALVASVLGAGAPAAAGTADTAAVGTFQYLVEHDLRKCASPRCGGYWVALANHRRTACSDGVLRRRCYVAVAADSRGRELETRLPQGAIVRADLESRDFGSFGELGLLVVAELHGPAGRDPSGPFFRVRDLGIRCVRAPCFSLRAARLNRPSRVTLSGLDLRPARLSERDRSRAEAALSATSGLFVSGKVVATADGGRTLRVTRVYLRGATPRG
jgi:hypothetical protein